VGVQRAATSVCAAQPCQSNPAPLARQGLLLVRRLATRRVNYRAQLARLLPVHQKHGRGI